MATTKKELDDIRLENEKKRRQIAEEERKAASLQAMVENGTTKDSLEKESARLDAELAKAKQSVTTLEKISGVSADTLNLPALRGAPPVLTTESKVVTQAITETTDGTPGEATASATPAKRGQK